MKNKSTGFTSEIAAGAAIILFLAVGWASLNSYGFGDDEQWLMKRGELSSAIVSSVFKNQPPPGIPLDNWTYLPSLYATVNYQWIRPQLARWGLNDIESSHAVNILVAALCLLALFLLVRPVLGGETAFYSVLFLIFFPRFLAHAHYNPKEIPTMAFVVASFFFVSREIESRTLKNSALAGVFIGLAASTHLNALTLLPVFPLCLLGQMVDKKSFPSPKHSLKTMAIHTGLYLFCAALILFICWPLLWIDPLALFHSIQHFSSPFDYADLSYLGNVYRRPEAPWHYDLFYLAVTMPVLTLACMGWGGVQAFKNTENKTQRQFLWMLFWWAFFPIAVRANPWTVKYNDIRHVFISVPPLMIFAGWGLKNILGSLKKRSFWLMTAALPVYFLLQIIPIHPFEGDYFNEVFRLCVPHNIQLYFDFPSWMTPYKQGIDWLNKNAAPGSSVYVPHRPSVTGSYRKRPDLIFVNQLPANYLMISGNGWKYGPRYQKWTPLFEIRRYDSRLLAIFQGDANLNPDPLAVHAVENKHDITMSNGIISMTILKGSGYVLSVCLKKDGRDLELLTGPRGVTFDADTSSDHVHPTEHAVCRLSQTGDVAETVFHSEPQPNFPFITDVTYRLARGQSGFYASAHYHRKAGLPAATLEQTRFSLKTTDRAQTFTDEFIDDRRHGSPPFKKFERELQDVTYQLTDGTVYTKYDNVTFEAGHFLHGVAGHGIGMWMITPSKEFLSGGPIKQNLTVHLDDDLRTHTVLGTFQSNHFGAGNLVFKQNETWDKSFGPLFVYINQGDSNEALWSDAQQRAASERAAWPYPWLDPAQIPLQRGDVTGRIVMANGNAAQQTWVVLTSQGSDWTQAGKGYQAYAKTDDKGRFSLNKVRPGTYRLFASGMDQFIDFQKEGVVVSKNATTALGTLIWKPVHHGKKIWQVGTADRSSEEFKNGNTPRRYGKYLDYAKDFPADVVFRIGQSVEKQDWNYAQWSWYNQHPRWTIKFPLKKIPGGQATLTFGILSITSRYENQPTIGYEVTVNGHKIGTIDLAKMGSAGYRSASQDSKRFLLELPFKTSLLKTGENEVEFGFTDPSPVSEKIRPWRGLGAIIYDAVRLEINETN